MPTVLPTSSNSEYYRSQFSLTGKTAIVTGAVGHLGSAISKGLAAHGADVVLTGRTLENLKRFTNQNNPGFNNKFAYYNCDVSNNEEFKSAVEYTLEVKGSVDILVNNAFSEIRQKPEEITPNSWSQAINNIQTHPFFCSQIVLPYMLEKGKGSIINIASIYGFLGTDQRLFHEVQSPSVFYSVAKGGLLQLTRRLATEYASKGIRVNAISPGCFPKHSPRKPERPGYIVGLSDKTPMQRVGNPDEIAGAAIYLASDASSFVTGQNLVVDGGWSAW